MSKVQEKQNLIIIRGNSGSGKTTIAKALQKALGYGAMVISQDVIRREILRVKDEPGNHSIRLLYDMAMYGNKIGHHVILEGVLHSDKYGQMLQHLADDWHGDIYAYYFDIPFAETLRSHAAKPNAAEFGEAEMKQWWCKEDYLGLAQEKRITISMSKQDIINRIIHDIG